MARRPRTPPTPQAPVPTLPAEPPRADAAPAASAPARRTRGLGVARRGGQGKAFTSRPVNVEFASPGHRLSRADLEIDGIFHAEASYEGRIFLNNAKADASTARAPETGYAGSFYVFGHGGCLGDDGHCQVHGHREAYDFRPPHQLTLAKKRIDVTRMLVEVAKASKEATITIVPVITAANELCNTEDVFRFEGMRFVSYNP